MKLKILIILISGAIFTFGAFVMKQKKDVEVKKFVEVKDVQVKPTPEVETKKEISVPPFKPIPSIPVPTATKEPMIKTVEETVEVTPEPTDSTHIPCQDDGQPWNGIPCGEPGLVIDITLYFSPTVDEPKQFIDCDSLNQD